MGSGGSSLTDMDFFLNTLKPTQENFDKIMKHTNCPFCRLPKAHQENQFLSKCTPAKKYGYTHPYGPTVDETRVDFKKREAQRKKTAAADKKDAEDLKKAENDRKAQTGQDKAEAERLVLLLLRPEVLLLLEKMVKILVSKRKRLVLSKQILIPNQT